MNNSNIDVRNGVAGMHLDTRSNTDVKKLLLGYSNWATKYLEYHHKGFMEIPSISTDNLSGLHLAVLTSGISINP